MCKTATKVAEPDPPSVLQPCSLCSEPPTLLTFPYTLLQKLMFCKQVVQQLPEAEANANANANEQGEMVWKWCIGNNLI